MLRAQVAFLDTINISADVIWQTAIWHAVNHPALLMQVAQALKEKCQRFLADQLPEHQSQLAQAAGTETPQNESQPSSTDDMQVEQISETAGGVCLWSSLFLFSLIQKG